MKTVDSWASELRKIIEKTGEAILVDGKGVPVLRFTLDKQKNLVVEKTKNEILS